VSTTEEPLERKSSGSGLEIREYSRRDPSRWPRGTLYQQKKLVLTSPTSSRTQSTEFSLVTWVNFHAPHLCSRPWPLSGVRRRNLARICCWNAVFWTRLIKSCRVPFMWGWERRAKFPLDWNWTAAASLAGKGRRSVGRWPDAVTAMDVSRCTSNFSAYIPSHAPLSASVIGAYSLGFNHGSCGNYGLELGGQAVTQIPSHDKNKKQTPWP
jgi:hypothetical protein